MLLASQFADCHVSKVPTKMLHFLDHRFAGIPPCVNPHPVGEVSLLPERKRQFSQPSLDPVCLDFREVLAIDPRRALVRAALGIGMRQNVVAADLVVHSVEAIAGFRLRFRV